MSGYLSSVIDEAMGDIAQRSRKRLYQTDFEAWSADVLGRRQYEKMRLINHDVVHGVKSANGLKTRTVIKSANGCGKSLDVADLITWWVTVFPPEDTLAIATAPTLDQIERVIFKYLKDNYGYAKNSGHPFLGSINESLEWKYNIPGVGNEAIAFGKRPTDKDIVSTFQGTRKLRTLVAIDEGGGVPTDLFTAAEAVATGEYSRIVAIGNPDRRATEFHRKFTVPEEMAEWNTHSISAYELPTMTGEIVYDDPEKQQRLLKGLTSREWIENKERVWRTNGRPDARFLAKVMGEFPGETDNAFFAQENIDKAHDTVIDEPGARVFLGVDLAAGGEDESVVYVNRGGNVRLFDKEVHYDDGGEDRTTSGVWSKEDELTSARRVHAIAMNCGADEVRVDAAGLGGGIFTNLVRLDEFRDKCYTLVSIIGSNSSPDRDQWSNVRSYNHDYLRQQMRDGKIDLDPNDKDLRDELLVITYDLNNRGAVQITPKRQMRSEMGGSPDRLDAVIYSVVDTSMYTSPDANTPGKIVYKDPWELLEMERNGAGMPI